MKVLKILGKISQVGQWILKGKWFCGTLVLYHDCLRKVSVMRPKRFLYFGVEEHACYNHPPLLGIVSLPACSKHRAHRQMIQSGLILLN